jgi:polygalacturonase
LAPANSPNTDAIDPFASSNVVIDHVYADVGDDNVAIKSGAINSPGPDSAARNITITDCVFDHGHGLSIGSELAGGAQNIHAERIRFTGTDQGIRIKANRDRGGDVGDFSFKDIEMTGVKTAILITEYYPDTPPEGDNPPKPITRLTPFFHDIRIENLKAVGSDVAGVIFGLPESPVKNVVLKNVEIAAAKGMVISDAIVTLAGMKVKAETGQDMDVRRSAKVSGK